MDTDAISMNRDTSNYFKLKNIHILHLTLIIIISMSEFSFSFKTFVLLEYCLYRKKVIIYQRVPHTIFFIIKVAGVYNNNNNNINYYHTTYVYIHFIQALTRPYNCQYKCTKKKTKTKITLPKEYLFISASHEYNFLRQSSSDVFRVVQLSLHHI